MKGMGKDLVFVLLCTGALLIGLTVFPGCGAAEHKCGMAGMASTAGAASAPVEQTVLPAEQTTCPVMGGTINRSIYTQYKGQKVYFCCAGCEERFLSSPETYVSKLPQFAK